MVQDVAGFGVDDNELGSFARGNQDFAGGTQGEGLRAQSGEIDLAADRGHNLVNRSHQCAISRTGDGLVKPESGVISRGGKWPSNPEQNRKDAAIRKAPKIHETVKSAQRNELFPN